MTGRGSRQKGSRVEYLVRDYLRLHGWISHRVPSSGAAQGFKGDVEAIKDGKKMVFEVKARKNGFKSIYKIHLYAGLWYKNVGIAMGTDLEKVLAQNIFEEAPSTTIPPRTLNKLLNMAHWLKSADVLVLKDNNKPLLFIRYTDVPSAE